jgi:hypothetical protein
MPAGPPKTLDIGEFGEVVVLIVEPNSVPYPLLSLLSGLLRRLGIGRCRRVRMSGLSKRCASNGNSISFLAAKASQRPIYGAYSDGVGLGSLWKSFGLWWHPQCSLFLADPGT